MDNVNDRYLKWLCGLVGLHNRRGLSYWMLARKLHSIPYRVTLDGDRDREYDGRNLRYIFSHQCCPGRPGQTMHSLNGPCSVLEMLVAFSMRIDDWLNGGDDAKRQQWFFQMLYNLNIEWCHDGACCSVDGRIFAEDVENRIDIWMDRRHHWDGTGGLFPLKRAEIDQRKVILWYQLQSYLKENYQLVGEDSDG